MKIIHKLAVNSMVASFLLLPHSSPFVIFSAFHSSNSDSQGCFTKQLDFLWRGGLTPISLDTSRGGGVLVDLHSYFSRAEGGGVLTPPPPSPNPPLAYSYTAHLHAPNCTLEQLVPPSLDS